MTKARRQGAWIGQARKEFAAFPEEAQDAIEFQIRRVCAGYMPDDFDKLDSIKGATVYEIRERFDTNTYRCVYTAHLKHRVYILTCFNKKSRHGKKTDQKDIDRAQRRLRVAIEEDKRLDEQIKKGNPP